MIKLDPRNWHNSAMEQICKTQSGGLVRAALTGAAAFATQLFVLIVKDTVIGAVKGTFRTVLFRSGSPNWSTWKDSTSKTAAYAKVTFQSGKTAHEMRTLIQEFGSLSTNNVSEALLNLAQKNANAYEIINKPSPTLAEITEQLSKFKETDKHLPHLFIHTDSQMKSLKDRVAKAAYLPPSEVKKLNAINAVFDQVLESYAHGILEGAAALYKLEDMKTKKLEDRKKLKLVLWLAHFQMNRQKVQPPKVEREDNLATTVLEEWRPAATVSATSS